MVQQVFGQFLGHAFGQRGYQDTFFALGALQYFVQKVINLVLAGAHLNLRIEQSRGAYDLFHHDPFGLLQLIVGRGGRDVDGLVEHVVELLKAQRAVVERRRQAESVLHEILLAGPVATVHGADLRHADVTLVDDEQEIFREEV